MRSSASVRFWLVRGIGACSRCSRPGTGSGGLDYGRARQERRRVGGGSAVVLLRRRRCAPCWPMEVDLRERHAVQCGHQDQPVGATLQLTSVDRERPVGAESASDGPGPGERPALARAHDLHPHSSRQSGRAPPERQVPKRGEAVALGSGVPSETTQRLHGVDSLGVHLDGVAGALCRPNMPCAAARTDDGDCREIEPSVSGHEERCRVRGGRVALTPGRGHDECGRAGGRVDVDEQEPPMRRDPDCRCVASRRADGHGHQRRRVTAQDRPQDAEIAVD